MTELTIHNPSIFTLCVICDRPANAPYRRYSIKRVLVERCVSGIHDNYAVAPQEREFLASAKKSFGKRRLLGAANKREFV